MTNQFFFDQLAREHMAHLHAHAEQTRIINKLRPSGPRRFRLWPPRVARGAPAPLVLIDNQFPVAGEVDSAPQSRVA